MYFFFSQTKDIAQIVWNVEEGMKFIRSTFENDFVILKLGSPLKFNINVQPACLPTSSNFLSLDDTEDMCFTSGWGRLQHGKQLFQLLAMYKSFFLLFFELASNYP
jgi:hypothetical protein